jgi:uncharacterized protein
MTPLTLSKTAMRRYVLGRQGLWPGRRAAGKPGVAQVIRQVGALQERVRTLGFGQDS